MICHRRTWSGGKDREDSGGRRAQPGKGKGKGEEDEDDDDAEDGPDPLVDGVRYVPRRRVVHFDMKGAPPTVEYFKVGQDYKPRSGHCQAVMPSGVYILPHLTHQKKVFTQTWRV